MKYVLSQGHCRYRPISMRLVLAFTVLTLSACSMTGQRTPRPETDSVDYALISENLVDLLAQYPRLNPRMAIVQLSAPDNMLEEKVHEQIRSLGYKIEKTGESDNGLLVEASIKPPGAGSANPAPLYVLAVGSMSAQRSYTVVDGQTQPASPIVVRGADEKPLLLNDAELFQYSNSAHSSVQFLPAAETGLAELEEPVVATEEPVVATPEIVAEIPTPVSTLEQYSTTFDSNLFDKGGQSNFSDLFAEYQEVESNVLVFPNDSLQLGDINKQIIEQYVEKMDTSTDVLSVIGCSHGDTAIENNGNALLAIGRANRVKEAFIFSGISHDLIVDEGCWAPVVFEGLPSRGVVLKLKRRIDS